MSSKGEGAGVLLKRWRKAPAAEFAEAMAAELAAVEPAGAPQSQKDWLSAAKALGREPAPDALAALLGSLKAGKLVETVERFTALDPLLPDPRVAEAFVAFVREVPFTSDASKPSWARILPLVVKAGDPRAIEQLRTIRASLKVRPLFQTWFERRLDEVIETLAEQFPEGVPEVDASTRAELQSKRPPKKAPSAKAKTSNALLEAVFARPGDDAARMVLADALQEAGDPRGELIALQCTGKDEKRQKALIKQHGKQWVGALAPWVGSDVKFRRGFPAEATLKLKNEHEALAAEHVPDWATLEVVRIANPPGGSAVNKKWTQWLPGTLREVHELHDLRDSGVERLLEMGKALRPKVLGFIWYDVEAKLAKKLFDSPIAEKTVELCYPPLKAIAGLYPRLTRVVTKEWLDRSQIAAVAAHPALRIEHESGAKMSVHVVLTHLDGGVEIAFGLERFAERDPSFDFTGAKSQAESTMGQVESLVAQVEPLCAHPSVKAIRFTRRESDADLLNAKAEAKGLSALRKVAAVRSAKLARYDFTAIGGDAKA